MSATTPKGEQITFTSSKTGTHNLDTYLEASEIGSRTIPDLLDDLFSPAGVFRADNFEFRYDTTNKKLQVRVGNFATPTAGWTDITPFFKTAGAFSASTTYNNFDLVTISTKNVYIVNGLTAGTTFASEAAFIASSNSSLLIDTSDARDWATKTTGQIDSTDYSAKAYAIGGTGVDGAAGSAKDWATKTSATVDGTNYSSKYWATQADVAAVAGKATEIGRLGTAAAVADLAILGTTDVVSDMNILATTAIVADMNLLATTAVVADLAILGTTDVVADLAILGTTSVVSDLAILATSAIVTDMDILATSAKVTAMGTLGTSANVTSMSTLAGISSDITTVAGKETEIGRLGTTATEPLASWFHLTKCPISVFTILI